jgi:hypothetical protein
MTMTWRVGLILVLGAASCAPGGRHPREDGAQEEDCGCDGPIEPGGASVHFDCGERFCHEGRTYECGEDGHGVLVADDCGVECVPSAELCDSMDNDCDGAIDEGVRDEDTGLCLGETTCEERTRWIYLVSDDDELVRFEPDRRALDVVGRMECDDAPLDFRPFSMAVDRAGWAWVLFANLGTTEPGRLFRVSVADASCEPTEFEPGQSGFARFGMGFVSDEAGSEAETLFIAGGEDLVTDQRLGRVGMDDLAVTSVGELPGSPELTGTGDAELWGFFPDVTPAMVARIDRGSASTDRVIELDSISAAQTEAWAFAFWGGRFYVFLKTASDVSTRIHEVDPEDGTIETVVDDTGHRIVGAGVSTCAPVELI